MSRYLLCSQAKKQAQTKPDSLVALNTNLHWDLRESGRPCTPIGGCNRKTEDRKRTRVNSGCKRVPRKKAKILAKENMSERCTATQSSSNKRLRKLPTGETLKEKSGGEVDLLEKLPVEVLLQIFIHLQSLDILRLSRTSKYLHSILMSKTSEFIWRTARSNVEDLPPLPPDLNEPQFANLMFDPYCHNCMREDCEDFVWEYHMRCCIKCQYDILVTFHDMQDKGLSSSSLREIRRIVPGQALRLPKKKMCLCNVFLPSVVERCVSEYEATEGDSEKKARWLDERKCDYKALRDHAKLCWQWEKQQIINRMRKLANTFKSATDWNDTQVQDYYDTLRKLSCRLQHGY